jgi:hypothetical protein
MPPPKREKPEDYHYHTYDYDGSVAFKPGKAQPDRGGYQFYSMMKDLEGLVVTGQGNKVPNIRLIRGAKRTVEGRHTIVLEFGNSGNLANVPTVVLTGGIHAREWIAAEIVYLVAEYLIMHYTIEEPRNRYQQAIYDLINSRNIRIIPMLNPDGNDYSVFSPRAGARLWRQNRRPLPKTTPDWVTALTTPGAEPGSRVPNPPFDNVRRELIAGKYRALYDVPDYDPGNGVPPNSPLNYHRDRQLAVGEIGVDPNRNNDTPAFGYGAPPDYDDWDPETNTYWGPGKCSEAETANVRAYLTPVAGVATAIDYHSYGQNIMYPTEAFNNGVVGADCTYLGMLLENLIKSKDGKRYTLGPGSMIGYDTTGATDDYMALRRRARAFTIELDPEGDNPGFELPQERIMTVFEKNIRGAMAAIAAPARGAPESLDEQRLAMSFGALRFLNWDVYDCGNQLPDP